MRNDALPPLLFPRVAVLVSQDGSTPLHAAAKRGNSEVVERLIAARAMVDAADKVAPRTRHTALCPMPASPHQSKPRDGGGCLAGFRRVDLAASAPPPRQCGLPLWQ